MLFAANNTDSGGFKLGVRTSFALLASASVSCEEVVGMVDVLYGVAPVEDPMMLI
jgi:hypothetical protein